MSFSDVRAIYFDLDDTLCGYWDASKAGLREAFREFGPEGHSVEEMVTHWAKAFRAFSPTLKKTGWYETYLKQGEPTRTEQMRLTLLEVGIDDPALARKLGDAYGAARDRNLRLFDDAIEVLEALKPRYPLGLVTNGPADIQRQEIATLGIESYFQNIFIEGEMGIGKPIPEVFERAAAAVSCSPSELLFVGNSYGHDIAPAIVAGWKTVWVRRASDVPPSVTPTAAKPEGIPTGGAEPDLEIGELRELLPALGLS